MSVFIILGSNIIKKAHLSADKQAVREMNTALAEWEASNGYAKAADVETVMQVLANAGYNTDAWICLTSGYEVYWFKNDNRMILYNASVAEIEYPEEYVGTQTMITSENGFFLYNDNQVKAQQFQMSLGSSTSIGTTSFTSTTSKTNTSTSITSNSNEQANLNTLQSTVSSSTAVKSAIASNLGVETVESVYMYATKEVVSADSGNAYASLQISSVGNTETPVHLTSNGNLVENLFYITIVSTEDATQSQIKAAEKAAGQYVYNIFSQISTGKVEDTISIIIEGGTTIDCSTCEWAPCKSFQGYFGTSDENNPIVIDGARLTPATGHASTVAFTGSASKYFVTGFFGTVFGDTTIENVVFKNLQISNPASDYELTAYDREKNTINTRNSVSVIGGITDAWSDSHAAVEANVKLKNLKVDSSCEIIGSGCVGGLVAYIGSQKSENLNLQGTVTIDNCEVYCNVSSTDNHSSDGYKAVGGILGFTCRVNSNLSLSINNCTYAGKLNGYGCIGGAVGAFQAKRVVNITGGDYSGAIIDENGTAKAKASLIGYIENPNENITIGVGSDSPTVVSGLFASYSSDAKKKYNVNEQGKLVEA